MRGANQERTNETKKKLSYLHENTASCIKLRNINKCGLSPHTLGIREGEMPY